MSTSTHSPKNLDQLREECKTAHEKARRYKSANFINNYPADADTYYLRLVREKFLAYMAYKKAEMGPVRYNKLIEPVYSKKLDDVEQLLKERGVAV